MAEKFRDIETLRVPRLGRVEEAPGGVVPYRVVDASGAELTAVTEFLRNLSASDCSPATLRSYAYEILGWLRFLQAVGVPWERATRAEARDYALWLARARKPPRHQRRDSPAPGTVNPVTAKPYLAETYAISTRRHARAVIHAFYEYHRVEYGRPLINPFPAARSAADGPVNAHHNPIQPWRRPGRPAPYQPKAAKRVPRAIPDERFNELFAALGSHRDRALLAFWISTGARAQELLTVIRGRVEPAEQLIGVVRKGSRALQMLPASADAFVWLRLYQHELGGDVPTGQEDPLWWTLRRPHRRLSYDAARMMFGRAQQALGSNWSLHDLRHSAAYRMEGRGVASDASFGTSREHALPAAQRAALRCPRPAGAPRGHGDLGLHGPPESDATMMRLIPLHGPHHRCACWHRDASGSSRMHRVHHRRSR